MSETSPVNRCPTCGAAMPANAPEGLCPKCLLLGAAAPTESGAGQAPPAAPTLDAVAAAFPQLEILEFIGQGGMGCVFKARQPQLSRFVALKILPEALAQDAAFAARFAREAQALAALSHPNIVTVHDSGRSGGFFYLLMEYVDGANLRQALRAGRFTPEQALAIVPPICDALQFAHEHGIVHRDIKPENVLLDKAGRVKIADFGIAKMVGANANTRPSDTLSPAGGEGRGDGDPATEYTASGTPQYMAPEQRTDSQRADHRADIYSLGVVFYEMLTGELPTQRLDPPSSRVRGIQIDVRLDEVVLRALEKSPELRWQTAAELRTQVETIATSAAAPAAPAGAEPTGRRYAAGIVGLAVFALVMIGVTIFTFSTTQSYIATAKILVKDGAATELATGVERIRSFDLLRKVATHLDLERRWARKFGSGGASVDKAVELLRRQTHSRFSRNARIVEVRFTSESRQEAAEIANKIADVYRSSPEGAGAEILQSAEPPLRRAKPNVPFNLAVGALAAIVLGSMAAGVMSIAARRVRHAGDGGPDKTRDMSAIPGISRRKNLVGVLLLCTPPTLSAWFVLIGYRVFGVDLDADTQFWTGLIGFPMSAGFGTLLAWLAGAFRGINEVAPTNGPRCWPARAIAATVLLLVSVLLMGGGMVMLALVTQERDWNPSSDEALFVLTIAGGGLLALAATTLVGWSARKQIQREPLRLRGWGGAFAAAWFWPGVATGLLALSLPVLIFADRDGVPPHLTTVSQKAELVAREAATNSARDAAQTSPRKVVDQWLESVKADRTDEMWNLTTRESGGAGSVDLKNTWEFDKIKAYSLAADDALAMVVSTGYKDNAGQERVIVFSLIKRDGRWLIRENAVTTPEGAESRIEGFTAHPGVKHDVRREDIIGRWTEAFFSPAIYSFSADGNFSMSFRVVGGSRTNLQGLWRLEDDRLTYRTGAGSTTGRVVRMREDFFQLKFPDGNLNSFHRMDGATGARPSAEFSPVVEVTLQAAMGSERFLTLDDGGRHSSAPAARPAVSAGLDAHAGLSVEIKEIHNYRLEREAGIDQWERTTPEELKESYRQSGFAMLPFEQFSSSPVLKENLPMTFLLPGTGFLQVTEIIDGKGPALKIRYKLLKEGAGSMSTVMAPAGNGFGPVIDRVFPFGVPCRMQYLQFHTGNIIPIGSGPGDTSDHSVQFLEADKSGGIDASVEGWGEGIQLVGRGCVFVKTENPGDWEALTGETMVLRLRRESWLNGVIQIDKKDFPATCLFKSAGGDSGILQILGFAENPRGVKIRYKLVQNAAAPPTITDQSVDSLPPVVVRTEPASGARDVAPGIVEIRVKFSKEMTDGSWSWITAWAESAPEMMDRPKYEQDRRTCVITAKLEPGKTYAWWLNSETFRNFKDKYGNPAAPYLLIFRTRDREGSP